MVHGRRVRLPPPCAIREEGGRGGERIEGRMQGQVRIPPYTRYRRFMALERDPNRNREHHLVRATEDVQVAALEVHREAAEWQIVSGAGIEAEVPLAIRVSEEGVHVVGAVVTDATRDIQAAIGRRRAEVVLTINRDAEDSVLRA